jgi:hypothetical protein
VTSTRQFFTDIDRLLCLLPNADDAGAYFTGADRFRAPAEVSVIASDRFTSRAAGWLAGELRAPN